LALEVKSQCDHPATHLSLTLSLDKERALEGKVRISGEKQFAVAH